MQDARRKCGGASCLGHPCTQPQPDDDSDSSRGCSDSEDEVEACMRRASRPCPNLLWKIMMVHRRRFHGLHDNVIFLVIDFLGMRVFPPSCLADGLGPQTGSHRNGFVPPIIDSSAHAPCHRNQGQRVRKPVANEKIGDEVAEGDKVFFPRILRGQGFPRLCSTFRVQAVHAMGDPTMLEA